VAQSCAAYIFWPFATLPAAAPTGDPAPAIVTAASTAHPAAPGTRHPAAPNRIAGLIVSFTAVSFVQLLIHD